VASKAEEMAKKREKEAHQKYRAQFEKDK